MMLADCYPTHTYAGFRLRPGRVLPFGASFVPGGVNFSVHSRHATACTLVLYESGRREPLVEIPFQEGFRVGDVFVMTVFGLDYEKIEYGYRMEGPFDPKRGHRFDPSVVLVDPYAKAITGRDVWGEGRGEGVPGGGLVFEDFDWEGDRPLETPIENLIIYEMHVRGFTAHPSSGVRFRGTFAGLCEKIPYLKELGVNCIELIPIKEFDEFENGRHANLQTAKNAVAEFLGRAAPVGFSRLQPHYARTGKIGMQVDDAKNPGGAVPPHRRREVFLDVVFGNHMAEGNECHQRPRSWGTATTGSTTCAHAGQYLPDLRPHKQAANTLNCNVTGRKRP